MFCPFCGKEINDESRFCSCCGKEMKDKPQINVNGDQQKDNQVNILQIGSFLMMVLGNFLCIASNFIPIYCEQEYGASYTYNIWEITKYVNREMIQYDIQTEGIQWLIFIGAIIVLLLGTCLSGYFFVLLKRGKKDIEMVNISKLSMMCQIIYVALAYTSVDYVDGMLLDFQSFSNNGFLLFTVAFMNMIYFHKEYSKYLEKSDEYELDQKELDEKEEVPAQEEKRNGLNIAIIISTILIICIIGICFLKLQKQKTDEQDVVAWNIAGNYCTEHLAKENGLIDESEHPCYGQYDEHIVTIYDITEESMHINIYHSRIKQYCFDGIVEYDLHNGVRIEFPRYPGEKSDQWGTEVLYITPNYIYCTNKGEEAWGINIEEYFVKVNYSDLKKFNSK